MSFRVDGNASNIDDGLHGAVGLFVLKRCGQANNASVAVHSDRAGMWVKNFEGGAGQTGAARHKRGNGAAFISRVPSDDVGVQD